jgi:anti-sigma factor RsiW
MNAHPTEQLSEYIDDELTPAARAAVDAHLSECAECAALVADLRAVVSAARSVGEEPPTWDLWPGIARRLTPRSRGPQVVAIESRRARRFSFSIPQLAAASIAVALLSAGAVWFAIRDGAGTMGPTASAPDSGEPIAGGIEEPATGVTVADGPASIGTAEYEAAVADLERLLDEAALDPQLRREIDENLAVIDQAIRQTREALEADPDDVYLNTHLASTMQRKIDVLQGAARLARAST